MWSITEGRDRNHNQGSCVLKRFLIIILLEPETMLLSINIEDYLPKLPGCTSTQEDILRRGKNVKHVLGVKG